MEKDESPIEKIALIVDRDKQFNIEVFHKAKLLLRIYRDVVWRTQEVMYDADAEIPMRQKPIAVQYA